MFEIFTNPWMFFWIGVALILRNVVVALPKPDESVASGFGSNSPGYQFLYKFAQGMSGDMRSLGFDPKTMTAKMVKGGKTDG